MKNKKAKTIVIIGAGLGGLAAGIYGQKAGYSTHIYEMASHAGGQCCTWKRGDYVFDCCLHHLMGCEEGTKLNDFWKEIGAMPTRLDRTNECVAVADEKGNIFYDYYDLDRLEKELLTLAPEDKNIIEKYIRETRDLVKHDILSDALFHQKVKIVKDIPFLMTHTHLFKNTMANVASRFTNPFLRKAFPLLVYSMPEAPLFAHLMRKAAGYRRDIAWPEGGSQTLIQNIVKKYEALGGKISYRSEITKILTKNNRATGVQLKNGKEIIADKVISDGDGRKTLINLLDGRFMNAKTRKYCEEPKDEAMNWAVHVFLGVKRDLSKEPSSLVLLLDKPIEIAGHCLNSLEMQIYGFDKTLAPQGKGVIKVELVSSYSYWKNLKNKGEKAYQAEKSHVTQQVITILEKHFQGIASQIETVDVPTILTWERYMNGTKGFYNGPTRPFGFHSLFGSDTQKAPHLKNFRFVGVWNTGAGATFMNALSGKEAISKL